MYQMVEILTVSNNMTHETTVERKRNECRTNNPTSTRHGNDLRHI